MKKTIVRFLAILMVLSALCIPALAAGFGSMSVSASTTSVTEGQNVTLTITLGDCSVGVRNFKAVVTVPDGLKVISAAVNSSFDATTGMMGTSAVVDGNKVTVSSLGNPYTSYTGGSLTVATITCTADTAGTYPIGFTASLTDGNFASQVPTTSTTTITVAEPPCEHVWGEWKETTPATCSAKGEETRTCTKNSAHVEKRATDLKAHDWEEWKVTTPATCSAKGEETRTCANDKTHVEKRAIEAKGHSYGQWKVTTAATCTTKGEETRTCVNDNTHVEKRATDLGNHNWGEWKETTAATCTTKGEETRTCANDNTHVEKRVIEAKGHSYGQWKETTAATCTTKGEEIRTCANDNTHVEKRAIEAKGHSYGEWTEVTAATCTEKGEEIRTCANDKTHVEKRATDAKGHHWEWIVDKKPTANETGLKHEECSECHAKQNENTVVPENSNLDKVPATGDITMQIPLGAIVLVAMMTVVALILKRKTVK